MSKVTRMFVKTDPEKNNNKFWECSIDGSTVTLRWGRIGSAGTSKQYLGKSQSFMDDRIAKQLRENYKEVNLVAPSGSASSTKRVDSAKISELATAQIAQGDSELEQLVKRLALANRHDIVQATGGAITFNANGLAQTALGIVDAYSIQLARKHLRRISRCLSAQDLNSPDALENISSYLQLIPQKVGARRGWHEQVFGSPDLIAKQFDLLDKLEQSISQAEAMMATQQAAADKASEANAAPVFEVEISRLTDAKEIRRITAFYNSGINTRHMTSNHRIKAIYALHIPAMKRAFEADGKKVGGIRELWHGTRIFNVLSILKSGLVIPKAEEGHVTGRMFGDGIYFSDQATKSLNYSAGYWDRSGTKTSDTSCFMFLADVAMGKAFTPTGRTHYPPAGYDSVFAKANVSNVMNNEMIVYRLGQANLTYLIEFES